MKNNRSFTAMLSAIRMYLTGGFRSKSFRRAIGLLLVTSMFLSSTGMVLARELDDEMSDPSTGIVTELTEESTSEPSDETSEDETSEDTSSDTEQPSDTSDETGSLTDETTDTEDTDIPTDTEDTESQQGSTDPMKDVMLSGFPDEVTDPGEQSSDPNENITRKSFQGEDYSVSVSYGPETGIPENAELAVREITDADTDEYYEKLSGIMDDSNVESARFFDISLVVDGVECEPAEGTTVAVKIVLNEHFDGTVSVVHLPDDQEGGIVDTATKDSIHGTEITFDADGFSAYAIVTGPEAVDVVNHWKRVSSIEQLVELGSPRGEGLYFGHPYGYLFTDEEYTISNSRTGIKKTNDGGARIRNFTPDPAAVRYFVERQGSDPNSNQFKIYCLDSDGLTKKYLKRSGNDNKSLVFDSEGSVFTITVNTDESYSSLSDVNGTSYANTFDVKCGNFYITVQGGKTGHAFASYNSKDHWMPMCFWYYDTAAAQEPYGLDGKTYGLLNTKGGNGGRLLQSTSSNDGCLDSLQISVVAKDGTGHSDKLYVSAELDATMWTFHWVTEDYYNITDENGKYLSISSEGLSMSDTPVAVRVVPGTDETTGQISLMNGTDMLTFSGSASTGFNINHANDRWLYLVEERDLTADYKKTYSARKISVSDPALESGEQVIVYTRRWEYDADKQQYGYKYYAIDHDGSLWPCYESGDCIQWTENMINTLLWDLTIYYWEGETPEKEHENGYYELYNEYSQKYIAPRLSDGQILSDSKIGIQLDGRTKNRYYSTIVAWDDPSYTYASVITTDVEDIEAGSFDKAEDFYFAIIQDSVTQDVDLTPLNTVDNNLYGIKMKMQDFSSRSFMTNKLGGSSTESSNFEVPTQGILSNYLDADDGYPLITKRSTETESVSLRDLYNAPVTVNHLFIDSTYEATGYFEYNSTQNFASLDRATNNFRVYQEIGTTERNEYTSKHGQFLPYNQIQDNYYSKVNPQNLYSMHARRGNQNAGLLPDSDPRKYEPLYRVDNPDYCFGMEMTASFIQTPSGLDDWGHDIIYEFTGDDDFWFYVDRELVIDLGGIHSALAGTINFATGKVVVNGQEDTLRNIFYNNHKDRDLAAGMSQAEAESEAQKYVDDIFVRDTDGNYVFRDYTTHTMKMFYMERGEGASNLHMKFNQSSVTPGKVVLGKKVSGIDDVDSVLADFPYQIFYTKHNEELDVYETLPLTNDSSVTDGVRVYYRGTNDPVRFSRSVNIDGVDYANVFYLKPGEECEISFPDDTIDYCVVECGVNPNIYSHVYVNGAEITETNPDGTPNPNFIVQSNGRRDYGTGFEKAKERTNVQYINQIDPSALRVLNIQKKVYEEDGVTEIPAEDCKERFSFRLYLSGEYEGAIPTDPDSKGDYEAYMYNYHVKDPAGHYCYWDTAAKDFRCFNTGDMSELTQEEQVRATFQTSMHGSISKIPAGYTVEVKGLMVGSHYMVEERDNELPDGYSRRDYYYYSDSAYNDPHLAEVSTDPVNKTLGDDVNPKVVVNNLKGYGLRVNKEWTDKDFMDNHDDVFFAVYKNIGPENTPNYVLADSAAGAHDAIHCITTNSTTSYWYYEHLDQGLDLNDYVIREVKLTGAYTVDGNGIVDIDYANVTLLDDHDKITIGGKMSGATTSASYEYTVSYEQGTLAPDSNIRVDKVINDRPGLGLTKTAWDGTTMLPNAEFTVVSEDGTFRKKFVSDENGRITKAFFIKDMTYHITEIKTPTGYYCPTEDITVIFRQDDTHGWFEVSDNSNGEFGTTTVQSGEDTLLGIKNKTYTLRVLKVDAYDDTPLPGAHFALHKQIKVGGITMFDYDPVTGYEDIVSNADGVIEELDHTLPAGTYELRELSAPLGYETLTHNIRFNVGDTGGITLLNNYTDVEVTSDGSVPGTMAFVMKIEDPSDSKVLTVKKTVSGNMGNRAQKFDFTATFSDANGNAYSNGVVNARYGDGTAVTLTLDDEGKTTFQLAHGESLRFALPENTVYTIEEASCDYGVSWRVNNGGIHQERVSNGTLAENSTVEYTNTKNGILPTGRTLEISMILGAMMVITGGASVMLFAKRRRKNDDPEDEDLPA